MHLLRIATAAITILLGAGAASSGNVALCGPVTVACSGVGVCETIYWSWRRHAATGRLDCAPMARRIFIRSATPLGLLGNEPPPLDKCDGRWCY